MATSTDERLCTECGWVGRSKDAVAKHFGNEHRVKDEIYICPICFCMKNLAFQISAHMTLVHRQPHVNPEHLRQPCTGFRNLLRCRFPECDYSTNSHIILNDHVTTSHISEESCTSPIPRSLSPVRITVRGRSATRSITVSSASTLVRPRPAGMPREESSGSSWTGTESAICPISTHETDAIPPPQRTGPTLSEVVSTAPPTKSRPNKKKRNKSRRRREASQAPKDILYPGGLRPSPYKDIREAARSWERMKEDFRTTTVLFFGRLVGLIPGNQHYFGRIGFSRPLDPGRYRLASFDGAELVNALVTNGAQVTEPQEQFLYPARATILDFGVRPMVYMFDVALSRVPTRSHHIIYPVWEDTMPHEPVYARLFSTEFDPNYRRPEPQATPFLEC